MKKVAVVGALALVFPGALAIWFITDHFGREVERGPGRANELKTDERAA